MITQLLVCYLCKSIYIQVNRKESNQGIPLKGVSAEFHLPCFLLFNLSITSRDLKFFYIKKTLILVAE